jgi:hypothetical protein
MSKKMTTNKKFNFRIASQLEELFLPLFATNKITDAYLKQTLNSIINVFNHQAANLKDHKAKMNFLQVYLGDYVVSRAMADSCILFSRVMARLEDYFQGEQTVDQSWHIAFDMSLINAAGLHKTIAIKYRKLPKSSVFMKVVDDVLKSKIFQKNCIKDPFFIYLLKFILYFDMSDDKKTFLMLQKMLSYLQQQNMQALLEAPLFDISLQVLIHHVIAVMDNSAVRNEAIFIITGLEARAAPHPLDWELYYNMEEQAYFVQRRSEAIRPAGMLALRTGGDRQASL